MKDDRDPATLGKLILAHPPNITASQAADKLEASKNGRPSDPQGLRRPV